MELKDKRIGFAITGSFCTIEAVLAPMRELVAEGAEVYPIFSPAVAGNDTRFFRADAL